MVSAVVQGEARARIAVVIPYFQRESGILGRALRSIALQSIDEPLMVVVVDDESPATVAPELEGLEGQFLAAIRTVARPNGGAANARNTGLDALPAGIEYVAFLDSDDEWHEDHLRIAVSALDQGHDLFFCDYVPLDREKSYLRDIEFPPKSLHLEVLDSGITTVRGDLFTEVIRCNPIGVPSAVVYRFARFPRNRFDVKYQRAGEDHMFWLRLLSDGARSCFSGKSSVRCGRGVNIYFGGFEWGDIRTLRRLHADMLFRRGLVREFALTREQSGYALSRMGELSAEFSENAVHCLTTSPKAAFGLILEVARFHPWIIGSLAKALLGAVGRKLRHR